MKKMKEKWDKWFTNFYKCEDCGKEWNSQYGYSCDDECECGSTSSPYKSIEH